MTEDRVIEFDFVLTLTLNFVLCQKSQIMLKKKSTNVYNN